MVSRQETARPRLTQGEVMQLPPTDELVMVAGLAPIRAAKLRYYEDATFTARILPAPALGAGRYADAPPPRTNDWGRLARLPDARLARAEDNQDTAEDGGLQQERHPGIEPAPARQEPPKQLERSEEHTSELQSLMRLSYAVFCLKK